MQPSDGTLLVGAWLYANDGKSLRRNQVGAARTNFAPQYIAVPFQQVQLEQCGDVGVDGRIIPAKCQGQCPGAGNLAVPGDVLKDLYPIGCKGPEKRVPRVERHNPLWNDVLPACRGLHCRLAILDNVGVNLLKVSADPEDDLARCAHSPLSLAYEGFENPPAALPGW